MCNSRVRIAWASAAPSVGSVPAPSSSKSTRSWGVTSCMMLTMFTMWLEKVDRLCSMDCSSPMSAKTCSNTASSVPMSAGTCRPAWAMRVNRPTVLRVTVLPPVLGPVMTRVVKSRPIHRLVGTTFSRSMRGCRPRTMLMRPSLLSFGVTAYISLASSPLAKTKSSSARRSMVSRSCPA